MPAPGAGAKGEGFDVEKQGDARVALIGFPSVGKSTILSTFTSTKSEAASYEFTTLVSHLVQPTNQHQHQHQHPHPHPHQHQHQHRPHC